MRYLAGAFALLTLFCLFYASPSGEWALLGEIWSQISIASLNLVQAITQRYIALFLWDPVLLTLLLWPAFLTPALFTALFLWAGGMRASAGAVLVLAALLWLMG